MAPGELSEDVSFFDVYIGEKPAVYRLPVRKNHRRMHSMVRKAEPRRSENTSKAETCPFMQEAEDDNLLDDLGEE